MRALSSAGLERLPYKQRVGGSNPSAPTLHFKYRALSSAGLERLPYKQRVGGSNPSASTTLFLFSNETRALSSAGSERLPYKQRVGGSNPSAPTESLKGLPFGRSFSCFYTCDRKTFVR